MSQGFGQATRRAAKAPIRSALGFWTGFKYPFGGIKTVYGEHRDLVRIWCWPLLITLASLVTVGWSVWNYHDLVMGWMWEAPTDEGWWASIVRGVHSVLEFLLGALLFVVGVIVVQLLSSVIAAPFNDALSETLERRWTGEPGADFRWSSLFKDLGRTVVLELGKVTLFVAVMLPAFVLSLLVPGVGQALYTVAGTTFTIGYLGLDYVDWPAARRGLSVGERASFFRRHAMPMLGFGAGVWVFLFFPFLNLLFMPAAVAGGTRLFLDMVAMENAREVDSQAAAVNT